MKEKKQVSFRYFPFAVILFSIAILGIIILYWLKKADFDVINISLFVICIFITITRKGIQFTQFEFSEYFDFIVLKIVYNKKIFGRTCDIYFDKINKNSVAHVVSIRRDTYIEVNSFNYTLSILNEFNEEIILFESIKYSKTCKVASLFSDSIGIPITERYISIFYPKDEINSDGVKSKIKINIKETKLFEGEIDIEKEYLIERKKKKRKKETR